MVKKRRKSTTPATPAQKKARERNWNKRQIHCMNAIAQKIFKAKTTSPQVRKKLRTIIKATELIIKDWNKK